MNIEIPEFSLVVLVGISGSGKTTFSRAHFKDTEVLSSDYCRALVSDDENSLEATSDAFEVLHYIAAKRLAGMRLTVIDATNLQASARQPLIELARQYHCLPVAIVLDMPEKLCRQRNVQRTDRDLAAHVLPQQQKNLKRSLKNLKREGFRFIYHLRTPEDAAAVETSRVPLWPDRRREEGPFDIIGDVHGCRPELGQLLSELGYSTRDTETYSHPEGRKAVFLGDLVDRGPDSLGVFFTVKAMVEQGTALCVPGNHDIKLLRYLQGRKVKLTHGLEKTVAELDALDSPKRNAVKKEMITFFDGLVSHFVLDRGRLVVAHAGMKSAFQGRASRQVREFSLYGETSGETDEFGLPVRHDWAAEYRGEPKVVYGHTPVPQVEWLNNTVNIDTGCVFGGSLTALRYPEGELLQIPAQACYADPIRPFLPEASSPANAATKDDAAAQLPSPLNAQQAYDTLLHLEDVAGTRHVQTRLRQKITVRAPNALAALEVMSRYAADPRWLIYLPPTMAPPETSSLPGLLEHPAEVFAHFRSQQVAHVVCQEKHMGSRAVVVICRDAETAGRRFGIEAPSRAPNSGAAITGKASTCETGIVYTRTGRRFFLDPSLEEGLLERMRLAMDQSDFWSKHQTDWACFDTELMPWSAKAQDLLRDQYAATAAAARSAFAPALAALDHAGANGVDTRQLYQHYSGRAESIERYTAAYRHYCWDVSGIDDLRLAPFHLLATEGRVHTDRDHAWHMEALSALVETPNGILHPTAHCGVDLNDPASEAAAVAWWEEMTSRGGEGMVVKPLDFICNGKRGLVQPALKCRGPEYLRLIYGPEYTAPQHLERLRQRRVGTKRSMALREFALGVEALERFVRHEPLRRVHECVFGVLALESEPVDPRL
jgi:protein phosphatase